MNTETRSVEGVQIIGVPSEVVADPRVQQALHEVNAADEHTAAKALNHDPLRGIAKYGVQLRPLSLAVVGPMLVQIDGFKPKFRTQYHMTAMLFLLGASLEEVYAALDAGEERGTPAFMALASAWVQQTKIPHEVSAEVGQAIAETFELVTKMMGSSSAGDGETKNAGGHRGS